jgi:hypothetical protein
MAALEVARSIERAEGLTTLSSTENAVLIMPESEMHDAIVVLEAVGALADAGLWFVAKHHQALSAPVDGA